MFLGIHFVAMHLIDDIKPITLHFSSQFSKLRLLISVFFLIYYMKRKFSDLSLNGSTNQMQIWFLQSMNLQKIHVSMASHFSQVFMSCSCCRGCFFCFCENKWTKKWRKASGEEKLVKKSTVEAPEGIIVHSFCRKHPFIKGL